jgi:hypothetical protein
MGKWRYSSTMVKPVGGNGQLHALADYSPRKKPPVPIAGLDAVEKRKISSLMGIEARPSSP